MDGIRANRREFVTGVAVSIAAVVAGCNSLLPDASTPTPQPLVALRDRTVYVAPSLSRSVPDGATAVDAPDGADVVLLPADTDRTNATLVGWLDDGTYVAFLGDGAQEAWHAVKRSDAYAETFREPRAMSESCGSSTSGGGGGGDGADGTPSDCEPPDMIVAYRYTDDMAATYRVTWAGTDDPSDHRVFEGIDDAIGGER